MSTCRICKRPMFESWDKFTCLWECKCGHSESRMPNETEAVCNNGHPLTCGMDGKKIAYGCGKDCLRGHFKYYRFDASDEMTLLYDPDGVLERNGVEGWSLIEDNEQLKNGIPDDWGVSIVMFN